VIRGFGCLQATGIFLVACFLSGPARLAAESVTWKNVEGGKPSVLLGELSAGTRQRLSAGGAPADLLRVRVLIEGVRPEELPAIDGVFALSDAGLEFSPRFPLTPGAAYEATFFGDNEVVRARLTVPGPSSTPRARVSAVYPSASVLPENLLKFYLHFSHSMSRGDVYRHLALLDEAERPVDLPFLEIGEELWNPEQTRLTLLFDPGRIKRGVKPLEDIGSALSEGRRYTLHVSGKWRDADGVPMVSDHRKEFVVGPADRTVPDPWQWKVIVPKAGTRGPLTVDFSEAMDQALASRVVWVESADGETVMGRVSISDGETRWTLVPAREWRAGNYSLKAAAILEDLAGNSIGRPFEVDVFERIDTGIRELPFARPFVVSGE
jgi:hypothetical protein